MKRGITILAATGALAVLATAVPAKAQGWHRDGGWHESGWRGGYVAGPQVYVAPPVYYAPPAYYAAPTYYAPPTYYNPQTYDPSIANPFQAVPLSTPGLAVGN